MIRSKKALTCALLSLSLCALMWSGNSARATLNISSIERATSSLKWTGHVAHEAMTSLGQGEARYSEYAFYHGREGMWARSWFQCDMRQSVALMLDASDSKTQRYLFFRKSQPAQQKTTTLALKQEADCAMQKCWWSFNSPAEALKSYVVEESHYFDPDDGYWTGSYKIGAGASEQSAESHAQPCRWFPRTRVAVITESQSLYVTETKRGGLVLRVYDHKQASNQPTLLLSGGEYSLNTGGNIETFTFKKRSLTYYLNIGAGEEHPLAEVFVMKRDTVIQRDDSLSYLYLKKSS